MARKKNALKAVEGKKVMIKGYLTEEQHCLLRHATAELGMTGVDYVTKIVVADAERVVTEFLQREKQNMVG